MLKRHVLVFTFVGSCLTSFAGHEPLFHENSKTVFTPKTVGGYFGYTILWKQGNPLELIVGAPKSPSAVAAGRPGALYRCAPALSDATSNVTCAQHASSFWGLSPHTNNDYFTDDMWLGASVAAVAEDTLLVCAPRWTKIYEVRSSMSVGRCFVLSKNKMITIVPLSGDGTRKEYGEYGIPFNLYGYAQLGMSVKVSEDQRTLVIGAPGLSFWSGGVVQYRLSNRGWPLKNVAMRVITSPSVHYNDYIGYSVETGVFESNGETLYVAGAPRGKDGLGQVLIFEPSVAENAPPIIKHKVDGPQLGAYFGASLLCADLDADGLMDVLVGAPNYVHQHDKFSYDQGAVFVYLTETKESGFSLKAAGSVLGSGASGARFGSAIAALGDVDGDGYTEVAVGAPWEEGGRGAVYVYSAHTRGLRAAHAQRISPSGARGFGVAISRGLDVDGNGCNDLAVGAHVSDEAYLFRCVPTITVKVSIELPRVLEQPQNAMNFTALFCVYVDPATAWPNVQLGLKATISVDKKENRAYLIGDSEYIILTSPGINSLEQRTVAIRDHSDLSRPILLAFDVTPRRDDLTLFSSTKVRVSDSSVLQSSSRIQLTHDCGEDLICQPELTIQLKDLGRPSLMILGSSPYIPGSGDRVGVIAALVNAGEPAYGAVINISLPAAPKRVPSLCEIFKSNMTCKVPSPLRRGENVSYVIELAYVQKDVKEDELSFTAEIYQPLNRAKKTQTVQELTIKVLPTANITIKHKVLPNATLYITREQFSTGDLIKFIHCFEVTNFGPSDWPYLEAEFELAEWVSLSSGIRSCAGAARELNCSFAIPALVSLPIALPLVFDLKKDGDKLERNGVYEAMTVLILKQHNMNASVTTRLILRAAQPLWPLAVGAIFGLLLLAAIVYASYKCGFFTRKRPQDVQETEPIVQEGPSRRSSAEDLRDSAESLNDVNLPPDFELGQQSN